MKRFYVSAAALVLAGFTSTALAQRPGGVGFGGGGAAGLLMIEEVQKELKITDS